MTLKTPLLMAAIAAGLTLSATAQAQDAGEDRGARMPAFEDLDVNADGSVTLEEIQAAGQAVLLSGLPLLIQTAMVPCLLKN